MKSNTKELIQVIAYQNFLKDIHEIQEGRFTNSFEFDEEYIKEHIIEVMDFYYYLKSLRYEYNNIDNKDYLIKQQYNYYYHYLQYIEATFEDRPDIKQKYIDIVFKCFT